MWKKRQQWHLQLTPRCRISLLLGTEVSVRLNA